jgi:hypothetical protein
MLDQETKDLLNAVTRALDRLSLVLEGFQAAPLRAPDNSPSRIYMNGRWHRRDGNVYGIIQAQPKF